MKIISLVPGATEILCALGLEDNIYGVSHKCNFPESIKNKEVVLDSTLDFRKLNSLQIDTAINESASSNKSIYLLDIEAINKIEPDFIITQDLCEVCAISSSQIEEILLKLSKKPEIITTSPRSIKEINESILLLADKFKVKDKGIELVNKINGEIKTILSFSKNIIDKPRVFCMDWINPIYSAGHWVPEIVNIAGGTSIKLGGTQNSEKITFEKLLEFAPHFIFIMPCGYDIEQTLNEINLLLENPELNKIPAFNSGQVYIVNANAYFSKGTYRLIEGIKIITRTINQKSFNYEPEPDAILNLQNYIHFESFAG
ncbi:ABC transporter substrate-binding protein [bacterium]|jgi:iron complex transport system substrate-binding protein|nr:ABC transporter substrate-binding protein [bacterium]MBT3794953.1 ABC transporter substrate-binding protein [bacterium]MBT4634689.1 ABC transporter substrate-binding protein [bacterium]